MYLIAMLSDGSSDDDVVKDQKPSPTTKEIISNEKYKLDFDVTNYDGDFLSLALFNYLIF